MQDGTEAVLMDASWQDGAAILMVRVTYRDVSDSYDLIYYYADPDTCELYAMDVYSYSTADDSPMGVTQIQYTYDDPDSPAASGRYRRYGLLRAERDRGLYGRESGGVLVSCSP